MVRQPWTVDLDRLTPKQLAKYNDSLEVLRLMRKGNSFSKASKDRGISPSTAKKFLGKTIRKRKNKIIARKNDSLLRKVKIYENGQQVFIQIKGKKNSVLAGQYHSAIGLLTSNGDKITIKQFRNKTIKDIFRKKHNFENEPENLLEILNKQEDREFFTIYAGDDIGK